MQKTLAIKAALTLSVFALLMIPLRMIDGLVGERAARQQASARDIASTSYGPQTVASPILAVPYVEEFDETVGTDRERRVERRRIEHALYLFPRNSTIDADAAVETKSRGPFRVRVYRWQASVGGEFVVDGSAAIARTRSDSRIVFGTPTLSVLLSDPRGLTGPPKLVWSGLPLEFERGSAIAAAASGLHASVPKLDPAVPQRIAYAIELGLHGTQSLSILPVADEERITLRSDWPHPSFGGQFLPLPRAKRADRDGFDATWTASALASNAQSNVAAALDGRRPCPDLTCVDRIDVRFIEPIDVYSLSDRALKYAFLFIGLTFGCFGVFELTRNVAIHPAQYLFVGLALATFFLLLLALSEHLVFSIAYLIASTACIALLGHYLSAVLRSRRRACVFAALFSALYAALYALLVSEDNALLLGTLLLFGLLASAMVVTRRIDWYALRSPTAASSS